MFFAWRIAVSAFQRKGVQHLHGFLWPVTNKKPNEKYHKVNKFPCCNHDINATFSRHWVKFMRTANSK